MRRSLLLLLLLIPIAAIALAGCAIGDDGPRTTQTRDVPDFARIDNRGSVDLRLTVGEPQRLRVRAGEKVIDDVGTEVHDGIDADAFALESEGSADVALAGEVARLTLELDGSGDADLEQLAARSARVDVSGSGDAEVRAAQRLDVDVDGSGDVRYHGHPALTQYVDGSGELQRED